MVFKIQCHSVTDSDIMISSLYLVNISTVWYFAGNSYICVMFVRRGSNYVCLNELTKFCEGWVNQSRINQTFRVLCVLFFNFFSSGLVFLLWNRLDGSKGGSYIVSTCIQVSRPLKTPSVPLKLKVRVIGGSKALKTKQCGTFVTIHKRTTNTQEQHIFV